jgi:hypothetical protein
VGSQITLILSDSDVPRGVVCNGYSVPFSPNKLNLLRHFVGSFHRNKGHNTQILRGKNLLAGNKHRFSMTNTRPEGGVPGLNQANCAVSIQTRQSNKVIVGFLATSTLPVHTVATLMHGTLFGIYARELHAPTNLLHASTHL